uniref:Uncharacterized protein n=1 Tax=Nicotiana tabacum TaxID=4097 RepID=A0A1S4CCQ5_TOBAC|nr:PREDICTED: uncharacterized protein LOC107817557 [Nicotiana tabacum]
MWKYSEFRKENPSCCGICDLVPVKMKVLPVVPDERATENAHLREFLSDRAKNNNGRNQDNAEPSKPATGSRRMIINMIFGGDEVNAVTFSTAKKMMILVTHGKRIREVSKDDITFIKGDVDGLLLPHNDALVISLNVLDFKIKRVLVDLGSLANIIQ